MHSTKMNLSLVITLSIFFISGLPSLISAAGYPEKPVTMLVGFPNGGPTDLVARALAESVKPYFAKPVVVVNKPGGNSTIATADLIHSKPDGYTIGTLFSPALTISPFQSRLPYKGPGDITPLIAAIRSASFLAVRGDAPWKTMKEFIDFAKSNPGKIRVGTPGIGSGGHIHLESLKQATKTDITHVPFEGAAPMITSLLGGHIEGIIGSSGGMIFGLVTAGKVRFLANYESKRVGLFPEVPTLKELGIDAIGVGSLYFLAAPKRIPNNIKDILYTSFKKGINSESFQSFLKNNAFVADDTSLDELGKELENHYAIFGEFMKSVKPQ